MFCTQAETADDVTMFRGASVPTQKECLLMIDLDKGVSVVRACVCRPVYACVCVCVCLSCVCVCMCVCVCCVCFIFHFTTHVRPKFHCLLIST